MQQEARVPAAGLDPCRRFRGETFASDDGGKSWLGRGLGMTEGWTRPRTAWMRTRWDRQGLEGLRHAPCSRGRPSQIWAAAAAAAAHSISSASSQLLAMGAARRRHYTRAGTAATATGGNWGSNWAGDAGAAACGSVKGHGATFVGKAPTQGRGRQDFAQCTTHIGAHPPPTTRHWPLTSAPAPSTRRLRPASVPCSWSWPPASAARSRCTLRIPPWIGPDPVAHLRTKELLTGSAAIPPGTFRAAAPPVPLLLVHRHTTPGC